MESAGDSVREASDRADPGRVPVLRATEGAGETGQAPAEEDQGWKDRQLAR